MSIADMIAFESKQSVFKSLNNQAPQYICNPFQRNSNCSSRDLRSTAKDLRLPIYTSSNGQKSFLTEEPRYGITLQLRIKRPTPFQFLSNGFLQIKNFSKDF